jgi:hypothetical protein
VARLVGLSDVLARPADHRLAEALPRLDPAPDRCCADPGAREQHGGGVAARSRGAHHVDLLVLWQLMQAVRKVVEGDVPCAGDVAALILVRFAHVQDEGTITVRDRKVVDLELTEHGTPFLPLSGPHRGARRGRSALGTATYPLGYITYQPITRVMHVSLTGGAMTLVAELVLVLVVFLLIGARRRFAWLPVSGLALLAGITVGVLRIHFVISPAWRTAVAAVLFASVGFRVGVARRPLWAGSFAGRLLAGELAAITLVGIGVWWATGSVRTGLVLGLVGAASSVTVAGGAGRGGTACTLALAASDDLVGLGLLWLLVPRDGALAAIAALLTVLGIWASRARGPRAVVMGLGSLAILGVSVGLGVEPSVVAPLAALVVGLGLGRGVGARGGLEGVITAIGRDLAAPTVFVAQGLLVRRIDEEVLVIAVMALVGVLCSRIVWAKTQDAPARAAATTARGVVSFVGIDLARSLLLVSRAEAAGMTMAVLLSVLVASVAIELAGGGDEGASVGGP